MSKLMIEREATRKCLRPTLSLSMFQSLVLGTGQTQQMDFFYRPLPMDRFFNPQHLCGRCTSNDWPLTEKKSPGGAFSFSAATSAL